jgi:flagellar biosynthesis/type III secretory pathway chaperone
MAKQIDELWQYAQSVAEEELKDTAPLDFKIIDADKVTQVVKQIEEAIREKEVPKKVLQKLQYAKKTLLINLMNTRLKRQCSMAETVTAKQTLMPPL